MTSAPDLFQTRLQETGLAVEALLDTLLGPSPIAGETTRPDRLLAAMRHGALGGGKRLRPFLLVESARLCGAAHSAALLAGSALDLVHCYSLVHDDLPAMDDDDLRRGRPTVHKVYDDAMAILAGDALLTLAFDVMGRPEIHEDESVRLALVTGLARASGLGGMAGGQALDLEAEGRYEADRKPLVLSDTSIRQLQAMKTGALLLFAVEAGGILGRADQKTRIALTSYGRAIGQAFQIADDILDVEADSATLGKEAGKDADRGKGTLVQRLGLDAAKAERDRLARTALEALAGFGVEADMLRMTARFIVSRGH
ncbi:MAG: polyprenyl synthetase family protein [Hyphomicrobiales bacterium]